MNPLDLKETREALAWALSLEEPSVIITRWPCVLKKHSPADKKEFGDYRGACKVDADKCIGCKMCIKTGCPALRFDKDAKKVSIDAMQCVGCKVCLQVCPVKAISDSNPKDIDNSKCLRCGSCLRMCPTQAKSFTEEPFKALQQKLAPLCGIRKENWYTIC